MKKNIEDYSEYSQNLLQQRCATRGPLANTGQGAEIFCGPRKRPDFKRVLPIICGWPANCLTRRAWHMQLWPVDQTGFMCIWPGSAAWLYTPVLQDSRKS